MNIDKRHVLIVLILIFAVITTPYFFEKPNSGFNQSVVPTQTAKIQNKVQNLLTEIAKKYASIEGYSAEVFYNNQTYKVLFKKPNKYVAESENEKYYCNGSSVWVYDKKNGTLKKGFNVFTFLDYGKYIRGKVVETQEGYMVNLLVVDKKTLLPLKIGSIEFKNVKEVKGINDSIFTP